MPWHIASEAAAAPAGQVPSLGVRPSKAPTLLPQQQPKPVSSQLPSIPTSLHCQSHPWRCLLTALPADHHMAGGDELCCMGPV
jgi:hypothetical protein